MFPSAAPSATGWPAPAPRQLRKAPPTTSAAATTNPTANPLLQDVNIGWIQKLRIAAPARVMSEAIHGTGKVRIGWTGDYVDLDALIFDLLNNVIDPWHRNAFQELGFVVVMMALVFGLDTLFLAMANVVFGVPS